MKNRKYCIFYRNLYIGESVKRPKHVKWKLEHGAGQFTIYCVTGAQTDSDQLDILHCAFLKQPYYAVHPPVVYAIAGSYEEAVDLIVRISDEALVCGLGGQLRTYLDRNVQS